MAPEGEQPPSKEQQEADAAEEELQLGQQPAADDDACLLPSAHHPPGSSSSDASDVEWEFHIVYSEVFRVPGLWLAAAWPDGRPLTEVELARALPRPPDVAFAAEDGQQRQWEEGSGGHRAHATSQQPRQVVERWTMLSQDEHPVLGRPFCCLHPCGTAARMRHLGGPPPEKEACDDGDDDDDNDAVRGMAYLIKWFGVVAPVVGLRYPAAFVQRVLLGPGSAGAGHG